MTSEQDHKTSARGSGLAAIGNTVRRAAFVCLALTMSCVAGSAIAAAHITLHLTGFTEYATSSGGNQDQFNFKGTWDNPQYPASCPHQVVQVSITGNWIYNQHQARTLTTVDGPCKALRYRVTAWFSCQGGSPWMDRDVRCSFQHSQYDELNSGSPVGPGGYDVRNFPSRKAMPSFRDLPVSLDLQMGPGTPHDHQGKPSIKLDSGTTVLVDTVAHVPYGFSEYVAVNSKMHFALTYTFYDKKTKQMQTRSIDRAIDIDRGHSLPGARLTLRGHDLHIGQWDAIAWYSWDGRRIYAAKHVKFAVRPALSVEDAPVPKPYLVSPHDGQVLVNKNVSIEVMSKWRHADNSKWEYMVEWQHSTGLRGKKYGEALQTEAWGTSKGSLGEQLGLPTELPTLEVGGGAQMFLKYGQLKPADEKHVAWYRFRVREHYKPNGTSQFGYGPWSDWFTFGVEQPVTATSTFRPGTGLAAKGQFRQQSQQQSSQNSRIRLGGRPTIRLGGRPTIRLGGRPTNMPALHQPAPAMHTMSGSLNPSNAPRRYARAGLGGARASARIAPHLRVLSHVGSVDLSCANLARFITIRETVVNDGGPLAAGHANLYLKETGGAHISSRAVPIPALAHGARTTLTISAGTRESYRGKVPGRHVLPVFVVVNGKTMKTSIVEGLRPSLCQVQRRALHPLRRMPSVKLNPQPEPPSAPRRLAIPHR